MDKMKKLSLLVSALAVTGMMSTAAGAMTRTDLENIRNLVESRNVDGLRQYLVENPAVMDASPIGQELAQFMSAPPRRNIFTALGLSNPIPASIRAGIEAAKSDNSLY